MATRNVRDFEAVEVRGNGSGRVRMKVIPNASGETLSSFVAETVVPGAIVHTDGWQGYVRLNKKGHHHEVTVLRGRRKEASKLLPRVHLVVSLLKRWLMGTPPGC
ncbi:MAG TPA: transposase, partial [Aeromicrobium sp.]|nr:transposase [Aeromicrobium sp.]